MKTIYRLLSASLALALLSLTGLGQDPVRGKLYTKQVGDTVHAVVEVRVQTSWHIYHGPTKSDMGPPDAVGKPTVVELSGGGLCCVSILVGEGFAVTESGAGRGLGSGSRHMVN